MPSTGASTPGTIVPTLAAPPYSSTNGRMSARPAFRIHLRNNFFMPLTSTGEHPTPISGLIAPRRLSSSLNQWAHSGRCRSAARRA
jgi:hypothetical protein